jgi:hypothetical protein
MTSAHIIQYTAVPPARFFSNDRENNEDTTDGPTPRIVEHTVCAKPFVAPSRSLLGAALLTYMRIQPRNSYR